MITIPTRAIIIPTHTSPESDGLPAIQYFDIVYYHNTGHSILFHSMETAVPLDELEPHIEQMDELKIAVEVHVPSKSDEKQIIQIRSRSKQAYQSVREQIAKSQETQQLSQDGFESDGQSS